MHIDFAAKVSTFSANFIQGEARCALVSKMDETDADTIDRLAEYCEMGAMGYAHIECANRPSVSLPCRVQGVTGNFATKQIKTVLLFHKSELTKDTEAILVEISRMGWWVRVEISNRQPKLPGLENATLEKITVTEKS
jgi:hypothetical protein